MIVAERNIDLFAGPGGWDEGAAGLGVRPLGIEWDAAACATRRARGHETLQADVSQLDPREFAPVRLMIASAPCQAFSMAGTGHARKALEAYVAEIRSMMAGNPINRERLDRACSDERGHLVLEPLRWALAIRPRFIACENVEPVLPLWEAMALALRELGYGTWAGVLSSECYGVPQTRRRAFLLAKLDGEVTPPPATHQRYIAPRKSRERRELEQMHDSLFDAPEPERIVAPEDRELLPWVSMEEALGWGMTAKPSVTVASGGEERRGAKPLGGGSGSGRTLAREQENGAWQPDDQVGFPRRAESDTGWDHKTAPTFLGENGVEYRERDLRSASQPAQVVTEKARSWVRIRSNNQQNAGVRSIDEPAPTIMTGHAPASRVWVTDTGNTRSGSRAEGRARPTDEPAPVVTSRADQLEWREDKPDTSSFPTHMTGRDWKPGGTREDAQKIPTSEPSPAVTGKLGGQAQWVSDRPATTVAGDPRVFPPGHKVNGEDLAAGRGGQRRSGSGRVVQHRRGGDRLEEEWSADRPADAVTSRVDRWQVREDSDSGQAVRVTVQEAAVLQGFPPDYPWQGTRTAQYRQIGDAVPPPWARAILAHLLAS